MNVAKTIKGVRKKGLCEVTFRVGKEMAGRVVTIQVTKTAMFNFILYAEVHDAVPRPVDTVDDNSVCAETPGP